MVFSNCATLEQGSVRSVDPVLMHAHQHCELFFLLTGRRRYFVGHSIYQVDPGDLVIIPPDQLHKTTQTTKSDYERYLLNFYIRDHEAFFKTIEKTAFERLFRGGCICFPPIVARHVRQTLEQIEREQDNPSDYAPFIITNLLQNLLLQVLCHGQEKEPYHGEGADKVQQVAHYITHHYDENITLSSAAAMAIMEPTYFSKQFKALTGFGFYKYLTHTRIQAAERLLRDTRLRINEVAEQCGFSDANHFGNVFSRWRGMSPSEYRRKNVAPTAF